MPCNGVSSATPRDKFDKGQYYSQTSVVGIAKGKGYVTTLTLHMDNPSWFFGIQIEQKFGLKCRIKLSELSSCFLGQFIR